MPYPIPLTAELAPRGPACGPRLCIIQICLSTACALGMSACVSSEEDQPPPTQVAAHRSAPLCALVGPNNQQPGVYGTDLGFSVATRPEPNAPLMMLFGDTWGEAGEACQYTPDRNDDLLASLPAVVPTEVRSAPLGAAVSCGLLQYELLDPQDVRSWARARLFSEPSAVATDQELPMGFLRTPVGAFRDQHHVYGVFHRGEPALCETAADCPQGMACSSELAGPALGFCDPFPGAPEGGAATICRDQQDCGVTACTPASSGMCLTQRPFVAQTPSGPQVPDFYRADLRSGLAQSLYIARKVADRPGDFISVQRFVTHRFLNLSLRTVAHFDPEHPENNDYRPGYHTLLGFGRPSFFASGGQQSLPFLFYVPLPESADQPLNFAPRFFAGYDPAGRPRFSDYEEDAQPIYGGQARLLQSAGEATLQFDRPEFDYVNQMSVSYVAPLGRWVMLYGGDLPTFMVADASGQRPPQTYPQPVPGAIHARFAVHPWGSPQQEDGQGWTAPEAVLTRADAAPYLVCSEDPAVAATMPGCLASGDPNSALDLVNTLTRYAGELTPDAFAEVTGQCLEGQLTDAVQDELSGNAVGRLYGVNIIEPWTTPLQSAEGEVTGVELYWNVSTWNPYQVVLVKTELSAKRLAPAQRVRSTMAP